MWLLNGLRKAGLISYGCDRPLTHAFLIKPSFQLWCQLCHRCLFLDLHNWSHPVHSWLHCACTTDSNIFFPPGLTFPLQEILVVSFCSSALCDSSDVQQLFKWCMCTALLSQISNIIIPTEQKRKLHLTGQTSCAHTDQAQLSALSHFPNATQSSSMSVAAKLQQINGSVPWCCTLCATALWIFSISQLPWPPTVLSS